MIDAGAFMGSKIRELAQKRQDLCDESGRGFWPVPSFFPNLLSYAINCLQEKITKCTLTGQIDKGALLTKIRLGMLKVVFDGDLGEDHTSLFLTDHKKILELVRGYYKHLPFYNFCKRVLEIDNPIILLGILTRNEEGSLEEAKALVEKKLIGRGEFARIHIIGEEEHGRISAEIREVLIKHSKFRDDFAKGLKLHDELYSTIVD